MKAVNDQQYSSEVDELKLGQKSLASDRSHFEVRNNVF